MYNYLSDTYSDSEEDPQEKETKDTRENSFTDESLTDMTKAEEMYRQNCLDCHGSDLSGGTGPSLIDVGEHYPAEEIEYIIVNGIGDMPTNNLTDDEAATIAEWLLSLNGLPHDTHSIDQDLSVTTDEITTDLKDDHFVRIQFQLVTDSEDATSELENKLFQAHNILIKELAIKTSEEIKNMNAIENEVKEQLNMIMTQGQIIDVHIINKVIQ